MTEDEIDAEATRIAEQWKAKKAKKAASEEKARQDRAATARANAEAAKAEIDRPGLAKRAVTKVADATSGLASRTWSGMPDLLGGLLEFGGTGDEISGFQAALMASADKATGGRLSGVDPSFIDPLEAGYEATDEKRREAAQRRVDSPIASRVGDVLGTALLTAPLAALGPTVAAAKPGAHILTRMLTGAANATVPGAIGGGVSGFARGENSIGNRVGSGLGGAIGGALAGGVLGGLAPVVASGARAGRDALLAGARAPLGSMTSAGAKAGRDTLAREISPTTADLPGNFATRIFHEARQRLEANQSAARALAGSVGDELRLQRQGPLGALTPSEPLSTGATTQSIVDDLAPEWTPPLPAPPPAMFPPSARPMEALAAERVMGRPMSNQGMAMLPADAPEDLASMMMAGRLRPPPIPPPGSPLFSPPPVYGPPTPPPPYLMAQRMLNRSQPQLALPATPAGSHLDPTTGGAFAAPRLPTPDVPPSLGPFGTMFDPQTGAMFKPSPWLPYGPPSPPQAALPATPPLRQLAQHAEPTPLPGSIRPNQAAALVRRAEPQGGFIGPVYREPVTIRGVTGWTKPPRSASSSIEDPQILMNLAGDAARLQQLGKPLTPAHQAAVDRLAELAAMFGPGG